MKCTWGELLPPPSSYSVLSLVFGLWGHRAGKTHTMLGREGTPGIMYLTTMELYRRLEACREEKRFEVLISYLEVWLLVCTAAHPLSTTPEAGSGVEQAGGAEGRKWEDGAQRADTARERLR